MIHQNKPLSPWLRLFFQLNIWSHVLCSLDFFLKYITPGSDFDMFAHLSLQIQISISTICSLSLSLSSLLSEYYNPPLNALVVVQFVSSYCLKPWCAPGWCDVSQWALFRLFGCVIQKQASFTGGSPAAVKRGWKSRMWVFFRVSALSNLQLWENIKKAEPKREKGSLRAAGEPRQRCICEGCWIYCRVHTVCLPHNQTAPT